MSTAKNEHGYSLIDIILTFVLIGIVAGVGWFVLKSNKSADQSFENAKNALDVAIKKVKPAPTIPKDWKTFTSQKSKLSFSYPSTWTLKDTPAAKQPAYRIETATLEGPNGFTMQYNLELFKGREVINTGRSCVVFNQHATAKLSNSLYYLTEGLSTAESSTIYLTNTSSSDAKGCGFSFNLNVLSSEMGYQFYGNYVKGSSKPTVDFLALPEVDIAKQIFSTFKEK
jgi:type II secretory pathway pseudopilin PulG